MSNYALTWAFSQDIKPAGKKFVLVALSDAANHDGYCYPSTETIQAMTCQSDTTVQAHLAALEMDGILQIESRYRENGSQTTNGYWLVGFIPQKLEAKNTKSTPRNPAPIPPENLGGEGQDFGGGRGKVFRGQIEPSVEPSVEPVVTTTFTENVLATNAVQTSDVKDQIQQLEKQALQNLKGLPANERHWFGSIYNPAGKFSTKHHVLGVSLELFQNLIAFAKILKSGTGKHVTNETFGVWLDQVSNDLLEFGSPRVFAATKSTIRTPPNNAQYIMDFYAKILRAVPRDVPIPRDQRSSEHARPGTEAYVSEVDKALAARGIQVKP